MNNIIINKATKRSRLGYLMLCGLLSLAGTIQAAGSEDKSDREKSQSPSITGLTNLPQSTTSSLTEASSAITSSSSTKSNNTMITKQPEITEDNIIKELIKAKKEKISGHLADIIQAMKKNTESQEDKTKQPQLLVLMTEEVNYVFDSHLGKGASEALKNLTDDGSNKYLRAETDSDEDQVVWQALSFLREDEKSHEIDVIGCLVPESFPLSVSFSYIVNILFDKNFPLVDGNDTKDSLGQSPDLAKACFYSDRFSDEQREAVISYVGTKVFPKRERQDNQMAQKKGPSSVLANIIPDQLLIPHNGQCLYAAILMSYLLPVRQKKEELTKRIDKCFSSKKMGSKGYSVSHYCLNQLHQALQAPEYWFSLLSSEEFSEIVSAFVVDYMEINKETWGGEAEIKTIANKLEVNIQVYKPDSDDPIKLVESALIKPSKVKSKITTLHIVQAAAHGAEMLSEAEKKSTGDNAEQESTGDNTNCQHYRLKFTLIPSEEEMSIKDVKDEERIKNLNKEWFGYAENSKKDDLKGSYFKYDINVNIKNEEGSTALHLSAKAGKLDCVKYLVKSGATIECKDGSGKTALHLTAAVKEEKKGTDHLAVVKYLVENNTIISIIDNKDDKQNTALMWSAFEGNAEIVKYLVGEGADINATEYRGNTALILSAYKGHLDCVKHLTGTQKGNLITTINAQNHNGDTALSLSAGWGHVGVVKHLVKQGANVEMANNNGNTALMLSAEAKQKEKDTYLDIVKCLVSKGANVDHTNNAGATALLFSASKGHLKIVKHLLQNGVTDINYKSSSENTALTLSAQYGHLKCVRYLVEQGANIDAANKWGNTALIWSAYEGHVEITKYLLEKEANATLSGRYGTTALMWSAYKGYLEIVKSLLADASRENAAKIDAKNNYGNTALLLSAKKGHLAIIKSLVENDKREVKAKNSNVEPKKADINAKDKENNTALILSAQEGHLDCVMYLFQQGVSIDATSNNGKTALLWSAYYGHLDCIKYLVEQGAGINATDKDGHTPLMLSSHYGHLDCVKYLVDQGVDVNAKDKEGNTALMISAKEGHPEIVKYLLGCNNDEEQKVDIHAANNNEETAFLLSARYGNIDSLKSLLAAGADIHAKDKSENTALLWVEKRAQTTLVEYLKNYLDREDNWFDAAVKGDKQSLIELYNHYDIDVDVLNGKGSTSLLLSAQNGRIECVKYLVEHGADINKENTCKNTPLLSSAFNGHLDCVKYLVEQGADIHDRSANRNEKRPALHMSAKNGQLSCMKYLLEKGAEVNAKDKDEKTALHRSAEKGHLNCIKYLLQNNADINAVDKLNNTSLLLSASNGHLACVKYLLWKLQQSDPSDSSKPKKEIDFIINKVTNNDDNTALYLSASNGHLNCVKYLHQQGAYIQQGADIQHKDKKRSSALLLSAQNGHLACVKYFLSQKNADINTRDKDGNTAFLLSASNGHVACVKYLLLQLRQKSESDVIFTIGNKKGHTALHLCAQNGHLACLKYLVSQGANIEAPDTSKNTAFQWSARKGHLACVKYLVRQGANINAKNNKKDTALHISAHEGRIACVKYLVKQGLDINIEGAKGNTALQWAIESNNSGVELYLKEHAAACEEWFAAAKSGDKESLDGLHNAYGIDVNTRDKEKNTALLSSAKSGHLTCVEYLLQQGADINTQNKLGNTALLLSAEGGHLACVKYLLQQGIDVNHKNGVGKTALILSAKEGHLACVKHLLQQGADHTCKDEDGKTALQWAETTEKENEEASQEEQKVNKENLEAINKKKKEDRQEKEAKKKSVATFLGEYSDKRTKWFKAATDGDMKKLEKLFEEGCINVNTGDRFSRTALHHSAEADKSKCLQWLIKQGGDVNLKNSRDCTVIQVSTINTLNSAVTGWFKVAREEQEQQSSGWFSTWGTEPQTLQKAYGEMETVGINANVKDLKGNVALIYRARYRDINDVKYLVEQGAADINARGKDGSTALMWSGKKGYLEIVKYLVEEGADIYAKNNDRNTALILSAEDGNLDCVEYLVEQGADIGCKGRNNQTALKRSIDGKKENVVNYLANLE